MITLRVSLHKPLGVKQTYCETKVYVVNIDIDRIIFAEEVDLKVKLIIFRVIIFFHVAYKSLH